MKQLFLLFNFILVTFISNAQTKSIIYFDSNKSELKIASKTSLDSLMAIIVKGNDYILNINAYCDNTGNEEGNQKLSNERADVVANYFKSKNILVDKSVGFSSKNPIASNEDENGKAKNRRAEILLTLKPILAVESKPTPKVIAATEIPNTTSENGKANTLSSTSSVEDLEVGKKLVLKNMNFEGGTAMMLPQSGPTLKALLKLMKENPSLEIEIDGHVCCANDMPLSIERAQAVVFYLIKNGVNEKRLKYKGFSNSFQIATEETEGGRIQNRRVEIMVLKK